jgi:hypothetical protein
MCDGGGRAAGLAERGCLDCAAIGSAIGTEMEMGVDDIDIRPGCLVEMQELQSHSHSTTNATTTSQATRTSCPADLAFLAA